MSDDLPSPPRERRLTGLAVEVLRAATVDLAARGITSAFLVGVAALGFLILKGGSIPAWIAALAVVVVLGLAIAWGVWAERKRSQIHSDLHTASQIGWGAVNRYEIYTEHLADVLDRLQRVLTGDLGGVTIPDYIERGIIGPARDVLRGPQEDIRISVLLPDAEGERWTMPWAAGHSLDGQNLYNERIVDTLSRDVFEQGIAEYWPNVTQDQRFRPNPQANRPFASMLSQPIRSGSEVIGVLNVVSSAEGAFDPAEQRYVETLASIIGVAVSVFLADSDPPPPAG